MATPLIFSLGDERIFYLIFLSSSSREVGCDKAIIAPPRDRPIFSGGGRIDEDEDMADPTDYYIGGD